MACGRRLKLCIDQGATFRRKLVWKTGDPAQPVNLNGYSARMQIRASLTSPTVLHELTTGNGGITLGGVSGEVDLHIPASVTTAFDWVAGVYDLEMIAPNGDVRRLIEGAVQVSREVTR